MSNRFFQRSSLVFCCNLSVIQYESCFFTFCKYGKFVFFNVMFEFLTSVTTKIAVTVVPYAVLLTPRHIIGSLRAPVRSLPPSLPPPCLNSYQFLPLSAYSFPILMGGTNISEELVAIYEAASRHIPEGSNFNFI
jgi:hypothetical protein